MKCNFKNSEKIPICNSLLTAIGKEPEETGHPGKSGNSTNLAKTGPGKNVSPPETHTALINARLTFMEIDFGMNGFWPHLNPIFPYF